MEIQIKHQPNEGRFICFTRYGEVIESLESRTAALVLMQWLRPKYAKDDNAIFIFDWDSKTIAMVCDDDKEGVRYAHASVGNSLYLLKRAERMHEYDNEF